MTKSCRSPVMASIHETAELLHAAGVMDKQTMRKFDGACLTPGVTTHLKIGMSAERHSDMIGKNSQTPDMEGAT